MHWISSFTVLHQSSNTSMLPAPYSLNCTATFTSEFLPLNCTHINVLRCLFHCTHPKSSCTALLPVLVWLTHSKKPTQAWYENWTGLKHNFIVQPKNRSNLKHYAKCLFFRLFICSYFVSSEYFNISFFLNIDESVENNNKRVQLYNLCMYLRKRGKHKTQF